MMNILRVTLYLLGLLKSSSLNVKLSIFSLKFDTRTLHKSLNFELNGYLSKLKKQKKTNEIHS